MSLAADMSLAAYDYQLPPQLIAQNPVEPRDHARLLVVGEALAHRQFKDLLDYVRPGDLLVMNNTRVLPARLYGRKPTGSAVEILLLEPRDEPGRVEIKCSTTEEAAPDAGGGNWKGENRVWLALVKPGRRLKPGSEIVFSESLTAEVLRVDRETGGRLLRFHANEPVMDAIHRLGEMPLPPYIGSSTAPPERYQTVYADREGSVAAPTAGLHFTQRLLDQLVAQGVGLAQVTLHVGVGTFRPVEVEDITSHQMHSEWAEVSDAVVAQIQETKARGGRVFGVGTTAVRSLESAAAKTGTLAPWQGKTNLFIYPGYSFRVIDGMITNFHLPKSSLMMMVSALIGRQRLLDIYQTAIAQQYRFYSFGDATLLLPEAKVSVKP
jgi:S-adenosylmethionine:tRNA ribosyltransferase-isomerase